ISLHYEPRLTLAFPQRIQFCLIHVQPSRSFPDVYTAINAVSRGLRAEQAVPTGICLFGNNHPGPRHCESNGPSRPPQFAAAAYPYTGFATSTKITTFNAATTVRAQSVQLSPSEAPLPDDCIGGVITHVNGKTIHTFQSTVTYTYSDTL